MAAALATKTAGVSTHSLAQLTSTVVGRPLSFNELFELVSAQPCAPDPKPRSDALWIGSVGYEGFKDNDEFARMLAAQGVERLIDVRELPISRKRGFAKTALSDALAEHGVEYLHLKLLGNPKRFRDLYKAGRTEAGRSGYAAFLLAERTEALRELVPLLQEKRSALMCVEHDHHVCHRHVILDALRNEIGLALDVGRLG